LLAELTNGWYGFVLSKGLPIHDSFLFSYPFFSIFLLLSTFPFLLVKKYIYNLIIMIYQNKLIDNFVIKHNYLPFSITDLLLIWDDKNLSVNV
jgi:hypothetical protein